MDQRRHAFTLVELLVVIGIIALLISILLPSLNKARESANRVACGSNMRQIGQMMLLYHAEYKSLPFGCWMNSGANNFVISWDDMMLPYFSHKKQQDDWSDYKAYALDEKRVGSLPMLRCPSDVMPRAVHWSVGAFGTTPVPRTYMMVGGWNWNPGPQDGTGPRWWQGSLNANPSVKPVRLHKVPQAAATLLLAEKAAAGNFAGSDFWATVYSPTNQMFEDQPNMTPRLHGKTGFTNYLFADGHIEFRKYDEQDLLGPGGTVDAPKGPWTCDAKD